MTDSDSATQQVLDIAHRDVADPDTDLQSPWGRMCQVVLDQQERINELENRLAQRTMGAGG